MNHLCAAIRFLTILPLPGKCGTAEHDLPDSIWFFPIVGLLAGGAAAALIVVFLAIFPPMSCTVCVVLALIVISGGLHMDGLADTADGFLSSRPRERVLEIMKDSHIGVMGVIAIVAVLLLKVTAIASIEPANAWFTILLIPLAGRCMIVLMICILPYARPEGGLGSAFSKSRSAWPALWALAVLATVGWLVAGWAGLAAGGAAVAVTLLFALWCYRKIGGATGDTYGAACELAELAVVLTMAAIQHISKIFGSGGLT